MAVGSQGIITFPSLHTSLALITYGRNVAGAGAALIWLRADEDQRGRKTVPDGGGKPRLSGHSPAVQRGHQWHWWSDPSRIELRQD